MPGLVPGIHGVAQIALRSIEAGAFPPKARPKLRGAAWTAGTSPAMTTAAATSIF